MDADTYKNAPFYNNKPRESALVWLDLLGFRKLVCSTMSEEQTELIENLTSTIKKAKRHLADDIGKTHAIETAWRVESFSDSIILAYPTLNTNHFEESHTLYMIAHYQMEMVISGFFVRGAMSIGDTFINEETIVSKALIEAYNDETKKAKVPRIMLSQSAKSLVDSQLEQFRRDGSNWPLINTLEESLLVDSDGQYFINYLEIVSKNSKDSFDIEKHKIIIETKLTNHSHESEIHRKYQWCAEYHNYFCSQHPAIPDNHKITTVFSSKPKFQKINTAIYKDFSVL
jgi:hypothetical protein